MSGKRRFTKDGQLIIRELMTREELETVWPELEKRMIKANPELRRLFDESGIGEGKLGAYLFDGLIAQNVLEAIVWLAEERDANVEDLMKVSDLLLRIKPQDQRGGQSPVVGAQVIGRNHRVDPEQSTRPVHTTVGIDDTVHTTAVRWVRAQTHPGR